MVQGSFAESEERSDVLRLGDPRSSARLAEAYAAALSRPAFRSLRVCNIPLDALVRCW